MTWFDLLVVVVVALFVLLGARQEAGLGLFDAIASLAALQAAPILAAPLTSLLRWQPWPETAVSPAAQGICFLALWIVGLAAARLLHHRTRWSMDQYDMIFGVCFGLLVSIVACHVLADSLARSAILKSDHLPGYLASSLTGEELRSFRSYHYVVNVCTGFRRSE